MAQVMFLRENYMEFRLLAHKRIHSSHHLRQQMNSKIQFYIAKTIRKKEWICWIWPGKNGIFCSKMFHLQPNLLIFKTSITDILDKLERLTIKAERWWIGGFYFICDFISWPIFCPDWYVRNCQVWKLVPYNLINLKLLSNF